MPIDRHHSNSEFYALRERIKSRFAGAAVSEPPTAQSEERPIPERLAQAIWQERLFRPEGLKTASGKSLEILNPGRWNEGPGPDFLNAEIAIGGARRKGHVEIHVQAGDWRRHGHVGDFAYNPVVLHACMRIDDGQKTDELHNGDQADRFEMEPALFPDLHSIRQTLSPEDYPYDSKSGLGRCHEYCVDEEENLIRRFLAAGGRERMEGKIRRLADQLQDGDFSQLLYQSLMISMGFRGNKTLFFLLSKRAPVEELLGHTRHCQGQEKVERIEAALLHVAGLTPRSDAPSDAIAPEALDHLNRINQHWTELSGYFADRLIAPNKRWRAGTRPASFPERRLAGIAHFVIRWANGQDLFALFLERFRERIPRKLDRRALRTLLKQVEGMVAVDAPEDFWTTHYNFHANPAPGPLSLIGAARARSIAFNSLIPILTLYARRQSDHSLEEFLWQWFDRFPRLESNNVERFMRHRLFGGNPRGKDLLDSEPMQQGLFQVFQSCCANNERNCSDCYFLRRVEAAH